jgi:alginate O-acetyltransferase complex protein AlgI
MALSSPAYLLFVGAAWLAVRFLPSGRSRKLLLLGASLLFYALLDRRFPFVLILLGLLTYGLGIAVARGLRAGWCAAAGIAAALFLLAFFKLSAGWLPIIRPGLPAGIAGWLGAEGAGGLLLPVGISFYTFQSISYLVDIRRRRIEPVRDGLDFGLYMAFFPKLLAGPIVRPTDFFRRIEQGLSPAGRREMPEIFALFLRGLFKKVVIADALAGMAGVGFNGSTASGAELFAAPIYWRSFYLFAIQIYADFSGYTDIARASARLLGIELPENFNLPYASASITEFWNRWHMSLTQWFREYVFFPLNRALLTSFRHIPPAVIQYATTIGMMLLIGLWHGAGLPFLAWGLWHGALLVIEKRWKWKPVSFGQTVLAVLSVFHLAAAGWVLFRSDSLPAAWRFFTGMVAGGQWFLTPECLLPVLASAAALAVVDAPGFRRVPALLASSEFLRAVLSVAAAVAIGVIWLLGWAMGGGGQPFLYGGF